MPKPYRIIGILLLSMVGSCTAPAPDQPTPPVITQSVPSVTAQATSSVLLDIPIARRPKPADYSGYNVYTEPPAYNPNSTEQWQVDLRSSDLTKLDLSASMDDLLYADFDSKTLWPAADKMPAGFNWQNIMETGKSPGLGIRALHNGGITGHGVGIAIVDQPLLIDHQEYKDRLRLYEEINVLPDAEATMHGAAVSSIALGGTLGVAPDADLYYIGSWTGDWETDTNNFTWNFNHYAQAVHRILEINQDLPDDHKIRVVALQIGWNPDQKGYEEITAAVNQAKAEGVFVISSSLSETHNLNFHGLGRNPLADPDEFESYEPGLWWKDYFYENGLFSKNTLLVPMDSRTTASPTGVDDYVFYRIGGWSWSIPYLAGMYALAAQVKPEITPDEFWETALDTGRTIQIQHDGKEYEFGVILDPPALIETLQSK